LTTRTNTAHCTSTNNKKTKFALRKVEDFTWPENQMWLGLSKTNPRTTRSGGLHESMVIDLLCPAAGRHRFRGRILSSIDIIKIVIIIKDLKEKPH
jgi:hypothetical protein